MSLPTLPSRIAPAIRIINPDTAAYPFAQRKSSNNVKTESPIRALGPLKRQENFLRTRSAVVAIIFKEEEFRRRPVVRYKVALICVNEWLVISKSKSSSKTASAFKGSALISASLAINVNNADQPPPLPTLSVLSSLFFGLKALTERVLEPFRNEFFSGTVHPRHSVCLENFPRTSSGVKFLIYDSNLPVHYDMKWSFYIKTHCINNIQTKKIPMCIKIPNWKSLWAYREVTITYSST